MWTIKTKIIYLMYCIFASHLPESSRMKIAKKLRGFFAKRIVKDFGKNVNIEKDAAFTPELAIGDNSGVGIKCEINGPVTIGRDVMMGPEVVVYTSGHKYDKLDIPMMDQGSTEKQPVTIGDDVWIGRRAIIMPGVTVGSGSVIGAGAVVTRDVPEYSVVAGVPAKVVRMRKNIENSEEWICI